MNALTSLPRIPQTALDAVAARIDDVRLPRLVPSAASAPGPDQSRQRSLLDRWQGGFDWRRVEDRVDELGYHESTTADGRRLAAIHARAENATGVPVLLVHGWPDSPLRFIDLIPLLTAAGHHVVAPAIPGFWRSEEPESAMSRELAADDFHALMQELGYSRYAVHAGDWGSAIAQSIAQREPEAVVAVHLTDVPFDLAYTIDKETGSPAEIAYLEAAEKFGQDAMYFTANSMQPNMVATVLADTPFGLATWLGSLYDAWSDSPIADDHIITNALTQYLTDSVRSSMRLYSEPAESWDEDSWAEDAAEAGDAEEGDDGGEDANWAEDWAPTPVEAPTAFALFPADIGMAPRELAEKFFAVERFTIMPRGGHFAALEEPQLLADDLLAFLAGR